MIICVLNDANKLQELLDAWLEAGVNGATVLLSSGMGRLLQATSLREDMPIMPSLDDFYEREEHLSRTLFSVVKDDATVELIKTATRQVIGDLNQPDTGLLIVLPVDSAEGMDKKQD